MKGITRSFVYVDEGLDVVLIVTSQYDGVVFVSRDDLMGEVASLERLIYVRPIMGDKDEVLSDLGTEFGRGLIREGWPFCW